MVSGGKRATAPCGHLGEHVTTNFVVCLAGCDKPKKPEPAPRTIDLYDEGDWFDDEPTVPGLKPGCTVGAFHDLELTGFTAAGSAKWRCIDCGWCS